MNLNRQAKILRVLQDQHFIRISGSKALSADCGIIAATNEKLQELITKGLLREDLYDRLSVITLEIPPLRERRADILLLAEHFLAEFKRRYGRKIDSISPEVLSLLLTHSWSGNICELINFMERAVYFARESASSSR